MGNQMRLPHKSALIALVLCVTASAPCLAFPGPPMSLVKRWRQSSLVAWVDVTSTGRLEVDDHPPGQSVVLSIRQILKGPAANPPKQVCAFTVFGSPFPFHFSKGQRLLVFLSFDDELKMYTPVAFEGCLKLSGKAFQRYAATLKTVSYTHLTLPTNDLV